MKREELRKIWEKEENWKCFPGTKIPLIYYAKKDPRIFVPKRWIRIGADLNFAHPFAFVVLALCFAIPLVPLYFLMCAGVTSLPVLGGVFLSCVCVLLYWAYYECHYRHVD